MPWSCRPAQRWTLCTAGARFALAEPGIGVSGCVAALARVRPEFILWAVGCTIWASDRVSRGRCRPLRSWSRVRPGPADHRDCEPNAGNRAPAEGDSRSDLHSPGRAKRGAAPGPFEDGRPPRHEARRSRCTEATCCGGATVIVDVGIHLAPLLAWRSPHRAVWRGHAAAWTRPRTRGRASGDAGIERSRSVPGKARRGVRRSISAASSR